MAGSQVELRVSNIEACNNNENEVEKNDVVLEEKNQEKIEIELPNKIHEPNHAEVLEGQEKSQEPSKMVKGFRKIIKVRRYTDAIFVRIMFIGLPAFQIYFISCIYNQPLYYLFYASYFLIILDGAWIVWKRAGRDYYWFSISFTVFILTMILLIVFEMDYKYYENDVLCETNRTIVNNIPGCYSTNDEFTICSSSEILVVGFLAVLVTARWLLPPSARMDREAIYFQVFSYTTLSADVLEIAQYMQNEEVAKSSTIFKTCQVVFSVSLFQFTVSLAAVKVRNMKLAGWRRLVDIVLSTEAWSQLLALFSQEIPCFVLRMILIFYVELKKDYSLLFFVLKNALMVVLMTYRIIEVCYRKIKNEKAIHPLKIN